MIANPPMHHVGIVRPDEESVREFMALFGLVEDYRGYVPEWQALCIFTKPTIGTPIEFVVPDGGPLASFNKGMGGLHHIALQVPDLDRVAARLREQDMKLLAAEHVKGAGPFICNFLHPVYTRGVQVEFVQMIDA